MDSESTTDVFSLPIHKSGLTSIGEDFVTTYMDLALCHELDENVTQMAAFTTMCSATSEELSSHEMLVCLTLTDLTRTYNQFAHDLELFSITSEKMATWFTTTQTEGQTMGQLLKDAGTMSGRRSFLHQTKTRFLAFARKWLRENSFVLFRQCTPSPSGSIASSVCPIQVHEDSSATLGHTPNWTDGFETASGWVLTDGT